MRICTTVLAAAAVLSLAAPAYAEADIQIYSQAGVWTAGGGRTENGHAVCSMATLSRDKPYMGLFIKRFDTADYLVVHVTKDGWQVPTGLKVPLRLTIDRATPWEVAAVGFDSNFLEFRVPSAQIVLFMTEFSHGLQARITFLTGNEGEWTSNLTGFSATLRTFNNCLERQNAAAATTQPFDRPAPSYTQTQPYNPSKPASAAPTPLSPRMF
jgi:hypothetical protein